MQFYFDESRENEPHALPDAETFYVTRGESGLGYIDGEAIIRDDIEPIEPGWYYWSCFPVGFVGPFDTEAEALADARENQ